MPNPAAFHSVRHVLEEGAREGVYPGVVVWVSEGGRTVFHEAVGWRALVPERQPLDTATVFDLASLTKPMSTVTTLMALVRDGVLKLEDPVCALLPEFAGGADAQERERVTLLHLLTHASGLPAWKPLFEELRALETEQPGTLAKPGAAAWMIRRVCREPLERPPGTASVYSDLGFMLLGEVVARASGLPLEQVVAREVSGPLGLSHTRYNPGNLEDAFSGLKVAATAACPWRGRVLCGVVHDDNAYAMGGVAGHAGLFATANDVGRWALELVDAWHGRSPRFPPNLARRFLTRNDTVAGSSWALGFDTPSEPSSSGRFFGPHSAGHLGFTGTSVWMDMEREWVVIVLTNRIHPDPENEGIRRFRPRLHDSVAEALGAVPPSPGG